MADLPWHPGDCAVTADGWRAVVIEVGDDGVPVWFACLPRGSRPWRADGLPDFVPDLSRVGTAAAWLRSCAEVVPFKRPRDTSPERDAAWLDAAFAIYAARTPDPWTPHDPALTARAVEATRAYLATLTGEKP